MIRFLIDEDNSPIVAEIGRRLGLDVVHVLEVNRAGTDDLSLLLYAAAEGRCLVTMNDDDFEEITKRCVSESLPHAGVLVIARSLDRRHTSRIAHAFLAYAALHPDGLPAYMLDYLHPTPGE